MGHGGSRPRLIVTLFGRRPQRNPVVVRIYIGRAPLPLANKWDRQVEWATHVAVYRAWKDQIGRAHV